MIEGQSLIDPETESGCKQGIKEIEEIHEVKKTRLKKRKVISAITRKTDSTSITRPSTACIQLSRRTASRGNKVRNYKLSSAISEKVRVKSGKRRPKTGVIK